MNSRPDNGEQRHLTVCDAVVVRGPKGLLSARCGHLRPCAEHDKMPATSGVLADLLRHARARRVLRDPHSTDTERAAARTTLGLSGRDAESREVPEDGR